MCELYFFIEENGQSSSFSVIKVHYHLDVKI